MAIKNGGKAIFLDKLPDVSADTLRDKNSAEITLSRTVSEINAFFSFMQKFKMTTANGGKTTFGKVTS